MNEFLGIRGPRPIVSIGQRPETLGAAAFPVHVAHDSLSCQVLACSLPAITLRSVHSAKQDRARRDALNTLAREVDGEVAGAADAERVKTMTAAIRMLAAASRQYADTSDGHGREVDSSL